MSYRKMGLISIGLLGACCSVHATNLIEVYQQALHSDPTYQQAVTQWQSDQEKLPIARADYLPALTLSGQYAFGWTHSADSQLYQYTLSLTQSLFDANAWYAIKQASAQVKASFATFLNSKQELIQRTSKAYFDVLDASDTLRYDIASEKALKRELVTAQEKFKVGLFASTDVYEALSKYDVAVATRIADASSLQAKLEALKAITGKRYAMLLGVKNQVPLLHPQPNNIEAWVNLSLRQNYGLAAARYTTLAGKQASGMAFTERFPVVSAQGNYGLLSPYAKGSPTTARDNLATNLGVNVNFPVFQGGKVFADTTQAHYNYLNDLAAQELARRTTTEKTRKAFLGVSSSISQILADKASVLSARKQLNATKQSFIVGTRTNLNVLNATTALYTAQQAYAKEQYAYITHLIELKYKSGTLSEKDLVEINAWLKRKINFSRQLRVASTSKFKLRGIKKRSRGATKNRSRGA